MNPIIAGSQGHEPFDGPASDLPGVEPDWADLAALECVGDEVFELVQEHIERIDTEVAQYGHVDELEARRYRRAVARLLSAVAAPVWGEAA